MSYEYYYNNARNRYYNACSEINSCQNCKFQSIGASIPELAVHLF